MVQRAVHRAKKGAMIGAVVGVSEGGRGIVEPAVGPFVVAGEHLEHRLHHEPPRLANQRMSGKESARGMARTDLRKPATCGGKAIS